MRKPILFIAMIFVLAMALSACAGLTPPPATSNTATSQPAPTIEQAAAATQPAIATTSGTPTTPECRVDTSSQVDPSLANRYPKVGNTDWTQGPDTAYVNIIEYSDFQ